MKIAIDISQVVYSTGVAMYTKNIAENLLLLDNTNRYLFFGGSLRRRGELLDFVKDLPGNFNSRFLYIPPKIADFLANRLHFPSVELLTGKVDVLHSSDWTQPRSSAFKVTTVHDLTPVLFPGLTDPGIVSVHKRRLYWVKREADRIIVPSEATRDDMLSLGYDGEKIRVIYEAASPLFRRSTETDVKDLKARFNIPGPYILAVGMNRRKNTKRILAAFKSLKMKDLSLVVIGREYSKVGRAKAAVFTGHVEDSDLPIFYSGAEALIYPSLYEGFGLPILEAFSCGCPVVTSDLGAMKEIAGDAAVLVDPNSTDSIEEGIRRALRNKWKLSEKGRDRVRKFSWKEAAKKTLEVYNEAK